MSKHTPGPWKWADWDMDGGPNMNSLEAPPSSRPDGPSELFPNLPYRILEAEYGVENEADKLLIAAAPELLEACKGAIAKVHYMAHCPFCVEEMLITEGEGLPSFVHNLDCPVLSLVAAIQKAGGE